MGRWTHPIWQSAGSVRDTEKTIWRSGQIQKGTAAVVLSICPFLQLVWSAAGAPSCGFQSMGWTVGTTPQQCSHADSTPRDAHMLLCSHPHMLISTYPHILICSHPHMLISTYPHILSLSQPASQSAGQPASRAPLGAKCAFGAPKAPMLPLFKMLAFTLCLIDGIA